MAEKSKRKIWQEIVKVIVFLLFYAILHFLYDWLPSAVTRVFSGVDESMLQHMKIGVFAYMLTNGFEFLAFHKSILSKAGFLYSRLLSNLLLPWLVFVLWYPLTIILGKPFPATWIELVYSLVITALVCVVLSILERSTEKIEYAWPARILLMVLVALELFILIAFSFSLPWYIDFFAS